MKRDRRLEGFVGIAQLRSDLELRRFSAFSQHVNAARAEMGAIECDLQRIYQSDAAFTIAEAKLANALSRERLAALARVTEALEQIRPGYEEARLKALVEIGRVEVLRRISSVSR
ncbi:hypothetical protein [Paracoccus ravus]|uniref:hypothetical protein n=1 Tax=Paracoccus ravus TaxID=2447760 RepID=UPI00106DE63B|nr:hypothetical protein [Paracoccus ravus]